MICTHCHTPNPTNAVHCARCGSGLDIDPHAAETAFGATIEVSDSASILTGADFGPRYHVESVLGSGGMGKVYKARDRELERTVAIKVLRPDLMTDPQAMQRFKHELLLKKAVELFHERGYPNVSVEDIAAAADLSAASAVYRYYRSKGEAPWQRFGTYRTEPDGRASQGTNSA